MGVRMVPFASLADRLYRIVRQTAKELGKRANLDIVGGQIELDRSVLDKMMAPLEHLLRNAVPTASKTRDERVAAGKPEIGEITVALAQEGNEIILSMTDDGAGLDLERIRARADGPRPAGADEAADDALLIRPDLPPGFSTAGEVTPARRSRRRHGRGQDRGRRARRAHRNRFPSRARERPSASTCR